MEEKKETIAGALHASYALAINDKAKIVEYFFSDEMRQQFKQKFAVDAKGSVSSFNDLFVLPVH